MASSKADNISSSMQFPDASQTAYVAILADGAPPLAVPVAVSQSITKIMNDKVCVLS